MKKSLLALATVLAIVAGCAKENFSGSMRTHSGIKKITATIESPENTKVYLSKTEQEVMKYFWLSEEIIKAGAGDAFADFMLTDGADTPKGMFETYEDLPEADHWFAFTPADALVGSDGDSLFVKYPTQIAYDPELGIATGCEFMAAKSATTDFTFHNAVGYIKFQLQLKAGDEPETIENIELSTKDGKYIAGDAKIVFDGTDIKSVTFVSSGERSATLTVAFEEDVTVTDAEPFVIYIPVAPMANGASISVTMKSGKAMTATSSTPVDLGQIVELPVLEFAPVTVAKVGDTEYYSIDRAVQAACDEGTDATVTLLRNCIVGKECEVLSMNNVITIDLNGKTLYSSGNKFFTVASGNKECIILDSSVEQTGTITNTNPGNASMRAYGNTTIKGGKLCSESSYGLYVLGGTLKLEGGEIIGGGTGLYCKGDANNKIDSVVVTGGSIISTGSNGVNFNSIGSQLIFRGGTLQSLKAGIYVNDGILKIYDGFIGAKSNVVYGNRGSSYNNQIDIYGGFFHRDSTTNSIVYGHLNTDTVRVWGGYYNVGPSVSYIPSGYEVGACDTTVNGIRFTSTIIKSADVVCEITVGGKTTQKATINEAFQAAMGESQPATVKLLADCSTLDSIHLEGTHDFTLDLNGKTLTTPGTKVFRVWNGTVLTIKSSQEGGTMFESASGSNSLLVKPGGKIILESGCIKGANSTSGHVYIKGEPGNIATFVMNGGEIWTPEYNPVSVVSDASFIMNGGTLKTEKADGTSNTRYCIAVNGNSTAEFNGGELISALPDCKLVIAGSAKINGDYKDIAFSGAGTIIVEGGNYTGVTRSNATNLTINGGTFTNNESHALLLTGGSAAIKGGTLTGTTPYGTISADGGSVTISEGVTVIGQGEDNNVLHIGRNTKGNVTINGGTFTGFKGIYVNNGSLSVTDGIFNTQQRAVYAKSDATVAINGGYFNTPKDSVIFGGKGTKESAIGGWYTQPLADSLINPAYVLDNSKQTTVEGVTYSYTIVENTSGPDIATVNGVAYKSLVAAINAATAYSGADNEVTIKLVSPQDTIDIEAPTDFTNENGKPVTIDFNSHVLNATVDSTILTKGVLTLTDQSVDGKGSLHTAKRRVISLATEGTVNIKKITLDCTRGGMGYTAAMYSVIVVNGTSSNHNAVLNVSDGARLIAKNHYIKIIYAYYGTVNTENCEIITKYNSTSTSASYPCIYAHSGCQITVGDGTYLQAGKEGDATGRGALYIATGNKASAITVKKGAMIWCDGTKDPIGTGTEDGEQYSSKTLTLEGGYINKWSGDTSPYSGSVKSIATPITYTNSFGEVKTFGFEASK